MFNEMILHNNSELPIKRIGSTYSDTIHCHSDNDGCCTSQGSELWKFPNGSLVPIDNSSILITKNNGSIGLSRIDNVTMAGGQYCCQAQDGRGVNRTVCINIQGQKFLDLNIQLLNIH